MFLCNNDDDDNDDDDDIVCSSVVGLIIACRHALVLFSFLYLGYDQDFVLFGKLIT